MADKPFDLTIIGCGDAFASGGHLQTAFFLDLGELRVLIDCGATTMVGLHRAGIDPGTIDLILLSHLHGDHFGGLPFLLLNEQFITRRTRPLAIAGPEGTEARLQAARAVFFPGSEQLALSYALEVAPLAPATPFRRGPLGVRAYEVVHPSGAPAHGLRLEAHGRVLAFSGDTAWTEALIPLAEDADLFLCECHSYRSGTPRHLSHERLVAEQSRLRARRMLLTHLGPEMIAARDRAFEVASEGMRIRL